MSAVTADSFVQKVVSSGLLSAPQCAELSQHLNDDAPPEKAAAYLIDNGLLTKFQVDQLTTGRTKLVLGQYQILDELGRGGFGCVYRARHRLMDRVVALKVIAPNLIENERARSSFLREVRATTRLTHPNIVLAYDADEAHDTLYFVMEFVDGMNLHQFVKKHGALSIRLASELLIQIGTALQYAHEQGMVHRDIKPGNLLVPREAVAKLAGQAAGPAPVLVKVVDFGLARLCTPMNGVSLSQTERGFLGTPDYVSPEQARDSKAVDIRADLYSVGCTLYFALTGRAPFQGTSPMEIIVQHLEKTAQPIERLRPDVPPLLANLVRRLMARDPDKRFQTPAEMTSEVRFFLGTGAAGASGLLPRLEIAAPSEQELAAAMPITNPVALPSMRVAPPVEEITAPITIATPAPSRSLPTISVPEKEPAPTKVSEPSIALPPSREDVPIGELWQHWLDALAGGAASMNRDDYRLLHTALLRALRNRAETPAEAQPHFQRLLTLVQPWLSVDALRQADRATLDDLRAQCQELGGVAGLSGAGWNVWWFVTPVVLATAAGLAWALFFRNLVSFS